MKVRQIDLKTIKTYLYGLILLIGIITLNLMTILTNLLLQSQK
jgi:hypothetical protein